ncbi:retrograde regulation protein 2 [Xanthoria parietina]
MSERNEPKHYQALVDMGSNGIRFSISDLSPQAARIMPTVYQDRLGLSLYDAQYQSGKKVPISQSTIDKVIKGLLRFKRICEDYHVPHENVRVVATEATRKAINSHAFRQQIEEATAWKVELLAKEDEGRIGAMGIASSFGTINGLVMDLGGGSMQMTWMIFEHGQVRTSPRGAVSFPYGAAAMMRRLDEAGADGHDALRREMSTNFEKALRDLEIPESLSQRAEQEGGWTLYLSGGGFRGWGYILMAMHSIKPYPIPIINGFRVPRSSFLPNVKEFSDPEDTFRISARRASQLPAISFLVNALAESIPSIAYIYFAQGGVREGLLFSSLAANIQSEYPLVTATRVHAPHSTSSLSRLLKATIPPPHQTDPSKDPPAALTSPHFLTSTVQLLYAYTSYPKDIDAVAALRSTTVGILGDAHGLSHIDRALLALVMCERMGGELSATDEPYLSQMQELAGPRASWWAKYIGRAAGGIAALFPAGVMREHEGVQVDVAASWCTVVKKKKGKVVEAIDFQVRYGMQELDGAVKVWRHHMEKVGKKKHWIGGKEGWGVKVVTSSMK